MKVFFAYDSYDLCFAQSHADKMNLQLLFM